MAWTGESDQDDQEGVALKPTDRSPTEPFPESWVTLASVAPHFQTVSDMPPEPGLWVSPVQEVCHFREAASGIH
jgi:hypothetical protein